MADPTALWMMGAFDPAVTLYVGNDNRSAQGRRLGLSGHRMFNGSYGPKSLLTPAEVAGLVGWCDSGAFNDPPERRLTPADALERQLRWEGRAADRWGAPYRHDAVVSYDLLIDEVWAGGAKHKRRWTAEAADRAVRVTVDAAAYLASQRERVWPRRLVLACQGVDHRQYAECAAGVLAHARPGDVFGLGGWCILGLMRGWLPEFWATLRAVLPMAAAAGLSAVHLFGVMWRVPLGGLAWLADRHGLSASTDSKKPVCDCNWKDPARARQAGARHPRWEDNVAWWKAQLAGLRDSAFYREPPAPATRQPTLFETE